MRIVTILLLGFGLELLVIVGFSLCLLVSKMFHAIDKFKDL